MQQATLAQSVEQRIRNAQVVSSSLMSGSAKAGSSDWNFPLLLLLPIQPGAKGQVLPPNPVFILLSGAKVFILHPICTVRLNFVQEKLMWCTNRLLAAIWYTMQVFPVQNQSRSLIMRS